MEFTHYLDSFKNEKMRDKIKDSAKKTEKFVISKLKFILMFVGLLILGLGLGIVALGDWRDVGFGNLSPSSTFRLIIPSTTALVIAFQTIYSAFFVSILGIQTTRSPVSPQ